MNWVPKKNFFFFVLAVCRPHMFARPAVPWGYAENMALQRLTRQCVDARGRPKWDAVSRGLPGRSAQEARCRYRRITDSRPGVNRCKVCHQIRRGHICPGVPAPDATDDAAAADAAAADAAAADAAAADAASTNGEDACVIDVHELTRMDVDHWGDERDAMATIDSFF
jgi:hypothetical protein